jgi:hypothetical protein
MVGFAPHNFKNDWSFTSSTRKIGFLVLYEADIVLKFWLPGLGHCRTLRSDFDDT